MDRLVMSRMDSAREALRIVQRNDEKLWAQLNLRLAAAYKSLEDGREMTALKYLCLASDVEFELLFDCDQTWSVVEAICGRSAVNDEVVLDAWEEVKRLAEVKGFGRGDVRQETDTCIVCSGQLGDVRCDVVGYVTCNETACIEYAVVAAENRAKRLARERSKS